MIKRPKRPPCRCDRLSFPHRRDRHCELFEFDQARDADAYRPSGYTDAASINHDSREATEQWT